MMEVERSREAYKSRTQRAAFVVVRMLIPRECIIVEFLALVLLNDENLKERVGH
jgi:hypothetical protein